MKKYLTSQRGLLYDFLRDNSDRHFTVYEIIDELCRDNNISKSSVYRNINKLISEGLVQSHTDSDKRILYQYIGGKNCTEHIHLKCVKCGQITHLDNGTMDKIYSFIAKTNNFSVDVNKTIIYGSCAICGG